MNLLMAGALFMSAVQAMATPTLYPENFTAIKNNTDSGYLADSENPKRFYVLPPQRAEARIKSLHTVTANVGFCREISMLQKYNLDTLALMNSMKLKDAATKAKLDEQSQKLQQAREDLAKYAFANSLYELVALDARITQIEKRLDDLYSRYKSCEKDCGLLSHDIEDSQLLRTELTGRRFELSAGNIMASNEYEKRKALVASLEQNVQQLQDSWKKTQSDLKDIYADFNRMFDVHAQREGGRVAVEYAGHWDANTQQLRRDNPQYSFEKIPAKNAVLRSSAYGKGALPTEGALLAFEIAGAQAGSPMTLEAFPDSFSGNAVLNLLGVCPLLHPDWFDLGSPPRLDDMSYGLVIGYQYPAAMKYQVKARYNMYRMYELIKSQGKSGGFFSSRSWSDQDEQEFFRDAFTVDWTFQDEHQIFSEDEKLRINADLRRQVMSRLAGYLLMKDPTVKLPAPEEPGPSGAMVLSNSLSKTCPANLTCSGASVVLNVLQAIFGSSQSQQTVKQELDITLEDSFSSSQVVMQPMLTSYY